MRAFTPFDGGVIEINEGMDLSHNSYLESYLDIHIRHCRCCCSEPCKHNVDCPDTTRMAVNASATWAHRSTAWPSTPCWSNTWCCRSTVLPAILVTTARLNGACRI